jgi:hypothetical protein
VSGACAGWWGQGDPEGLSAPHLEASEESGLKAVGPHCLILSSMGLSFHIHKIMVGIILSEDMVRTLKSGAEAMVWEGYGPLWELDGKGPEQRKESILSPWHPQCTCQCHPLLSWLLCLVGAHPDLKSTFHVTHSSP